MIQARAKSPVFEDYQIPAEGSVTLHAILMKPRPPVIARRLVLIPPLIGGSATQGLAIFRNLTRRGSILLSFEYRGHPRSTGKFELDATILDTHYAIHWAHAFAVKRSLHFHIFAMCYGAIAVAAQFRRGAQCPFKSFSAVSGLYSLDHIIRFGDFAPIFFKHVGLELDRILRSPRVGRSIHWQGVNFKDALKEYLTGLFPGLEVGYDYFEQLHYDRVRMRRTLEQLMNASYLDEVEVPPQLPCHALYGTNDVIMALDTPQGRAEYRRQALNLIPHMEFHEREIDHFGRGPQHEYTIETVADIFEESEAATSSSSAETDGELQP